MTKTEFILQTISNSAGPMLAALDTEGNQKFSIVDVEVQVQSLAGKIAGLCIVNETKFFALRSKLREAKELLDEAMVLHGSSDDWPTIHKCMESAFEKLQLAYLHCSDMEMFFEEDEEYRKHFHMQEEIEIMGNLQERRSKDNDNEDRSISRSADRADG